MEAKETIVILHGWGGGSQSFEKVKNLLTDKGFLVYCPDLPGFGGAGVPAAAWRLDDYVDFVFNFIQSEIIDKFYLFGHSFGERVGIKFAVKYPEKLKGLILCSAAGLRPKKNLLASFNLFLG